MLTRSRNPSKLVTLLVDQDTEKFVVHNELACHYTPVLKAAFESNFIEGQTQTYKLQDTTKGAVRLLVQWLYPQKLDTIELTESHITDSNKDKERWNEPMVAQDQSLVEL